MRIGAVILVVLLAVVVAVVVVLRSRRNDHRVHASDPEVMKTLRLRVLQADPPSVAATSPHEPLAIIMDLGMENGTASLFSASTGDASIYLSNGGGIIGGIGHERVSHAAIAFTREFAKYLAHFELTSEFPYPATGHVRFYVRTPQGVYTADRVEQTLGEKKDPLWPLFYAAQDVITELRQIAPDFGQ
jgi:hypothetical protein